MEVQSTKDEPLDFSFWIYSRKYIAQIQLYVLGVTAIFGKPLEVIEVAVLASPMLSVTQSVSPLIVELFPLTGGEYLVAELG